ncbi:MAG: helix-turn-helix domain-containing protein [Chloroflexi bacterium]|nr:helix-turn-helix domain-containing protein [Chloroflexota bacterium]
MTKPKRQDRRSEIQTTGDDDEMNLRKYVTTRQAAVMLGVGQEHIRKLLSASKVKGIKLGHDWLVFAPSMEKYFETKSNRGRPRSKTPQLEVKSIGQS